MCTQLSLFLFSQLLCQDELLRRATVDRVQSVCASNLACLGLAKPAPTLPSTPTTSNRKLLPLGSEQCPTCGHFMRIRSFNEQTHINKWRRDSVPCKMCHSTRAIGSHGDVRKPFVDHVAAEVDLQSKATHQAYVWFFSPCPSALVTLFLLSPVSCLWCAIWLRSLWSMFVFFCLKHMILRHVVCLSLCQSTGQSLSKQVDQPVCVLIVLLSIWLSVCLSVYLPVSVCRSAQLVCLSWFVCTT